MSEQSLVSPDRSTRVIRAAGRLTRWAALLAMILFIGASIPLKEVGGGKPFNRHEADIVRMLVAQPSSWKRALAQQFVKTIPERIIEPFASQTAKTIRYYVAEERIPKIGLQDEYFCWASFGNGGGYVAFLHRDVGDYTTVWDSLVPCSFISPHVQFMDLTGDSTNEIICAGPLVDGDLYEWLIMGWDGSEGHVLAPRLDRPGRHLWYNRLIGRALQITDTPGSPAKTLILTLGNTPGDSAIVADSTNATRVFHYDAKLGGFLPPP